MKAKRKKTMTQASKKGRRMRKTGTIGRKNPADAHHAAYLFIVIHDNKITWRTDSGLMGSDPYTKLSELETLIFNLKKRLGLTKNQVEIHNDRTKKNPKTARVAQKDITRAWGEYSNAQKVWGENNQVTQRALQKVYELKAAWEKQNPGRKSNPRKRGVVNRWGITVHVGDSFKVKHPHGDIDGPFIVKKLETSGAYVKAYGPRVIFEHGGSASIDDLIVTPHSYKKNPASKRAEKITLVIQRRRDGRGKWETWETTTMQPERYAKGYVASHVQFLKKKTRQLANNNPGDSFRIVKKK